MAENKYEWDFSLLYKTDEDFQADIDYVISQTEKIKSYEGKLNNKTDIVAYLKDFEKLMRVVYRLDLYAMMKVDKDTTNPKNIEISEKISGLVTDFSIATAFVSPELAKNSDEFLTELKNDKELQEYSRFFEEIIRDKKHTLTKEKEELMAGISNFTDFSEAFSKFANVEIKFDDITLANGEKRELTNSNYLAFAMCADREVRRQAHENLHKGFSKFNLTLSNNYINYLKRSDFFVKTYKFNSKFDMSMYNEEVDKSVYEKLIENVHKFIPLYQKALKLKAKELNVSEFLISDINAPISEVMQDINYETAVKTVLDMVKVMGEDYFAQASKYFTNQSIDVFPQRGKNSGAYSASCQIGKQFMLLNYDNTYNSVSTLAHELGHTMHSYYSEKNQPFYNQSYAIFVAEVASTVNEVLLANKLMNETTDKDVKKFLAESILGEFNASVFRQTMFSEFEYFAHNEISSKHPLTFEGLNEAYKNLQEKYFGGVVKLHEYAKYEWSRIPHFYRGFYVYKYATGFISAVSIAQNIETKGSEYVENCYKKFLSAGSSMDPVSILKLAEVDISSDQPYKNAFEYYDKLLQIIAE